MILGVLGDFWCVWGALGVLMRVWGALGVWVWGALGGFVGALLCWLICDLGFRFRVGLGGFLLWVRFMFCGGWVSDRFLFVVGCDW